MSRTLRLSRLSLLAGSLAALAVSPGALAQTTLSVALHADTTIPDPHLTRNQVSHMAMKHVVENLVSYDDSFALIPQLAESWTINEAGDEFTFKLRDGVKFHDGSELDAEDVRYSLLRSQEISPNRGDYAGIEAIEVVDPLTVLIRLKDPSPMFLAALAGPFGGYIVPAGLAEAQGGEISSPVGTGPYRWQEWRADQYLRLTRFEDYSADERFDGPTGLGGNRSAQIDTIEFRILPDRSSRITSLETGAVDFASRLDVVDFERFATVPGVTTVEVPTLEWVVLWFGWDQPFTQDLRFRQAVASAIDLDLVMEVATSGYGVANPAFMHPSQGAWYSEDMGRRHAVDQDRARELLREVGYNGEPIELLSTNDVEYMGNAALAIQQQLAQVGINVQLGFMDMSGLVAAVYATTPTYQMGMMSSSGRYDPDQHYFRRLHSSSAVNKYASAEYDAAVERARVVMDPAERMKLYEEAQAIFMRDIPAMLLFNPSFFEAHANHVKGFEPSSTGMLRFWNVTVER